MSFLQQKTNTESPVSRYIRWGGAKGCFTYWDKEKEENIDVPVGDIYFIPLELVYSIVGWHEPSESRIYSNLVASLNYPVAVRVGSETIAEGLWSNIKEKVAGKVGNAAKFAINLFSVAVQGDERDLVRLQLSGAALGSWFDYTKEHKILDPTYQMRWKVTDVEEGKKGAVVFQIPHYKHGPLDTDDADLMEYCTKQYELVSDYLTEQGAFDKNGAAKQEEQGEQQPDEPNDWTGFKGTPSELADAMDGKSKTSKFEKDDIPF